MCTDLQEEKQSTWVSMSMTSLSLLKSDNTLAKVKKEIGSRFDIKDLGRLHHFLRMKVVHDEATGSV